MSDDNKYGGLTEAQVDAIAEKAAEKAIERVYTNIGKSVVRKALYLIGAGALCIAVWLAGGTPAIKG